MICPLCAENAEHFYTKKNRKYFYCSTCASIFLDAANYVNAATEKQVYETHVNNPDDSRYQNFVSPLVTGVLENFTASDKGLDYGSGTNSAIVKMLKDTSYNIVEFDPYFANNPLVLKDKYNYITCCEVMEHFYFPKKEFEKLYQLLLPNGKLFCKTDLFSEDKNFDTWYYKEDPTHVFLYTPRTIEWIAKNIGFSKYHIDGRLIVFEK